MTKCPCCGVEGLTPGVLAIHNYLENKGFKITSAYRCEDYNRKISGAMRSQHKSGLALDIYCPDQDSKERLEAEISVTRPDMIIRYRWGYHFDWRKGCSFLDRM